MANAGLDAEPAVVTVALQCDPRRVFTLSGRRPPSGPGWEQQARNGRFEAIPEPFRWAESAEFAHFLNGYNVMPGDALGPFANQRNEQARLSGAWAGSAKELWLCLFYEHRRWRHFGTDPRTDDKALLSLLCEKLRQQLVGLDAAGRAELVALMAPHA